MTHSLNFSCIVGFNKSRKDKYNMNNRVALKSSILLTKLIILAFAYA